MGNDAKQITGTTLVGAGVGSLAGGGTGNAGMGAGIGAGAGAAIGVLTTLLTRGNDIVFPPGTTVEMVLNRPLVIQQAQLAGMPSYTGDAPVGRSVAGIHPRHTTRTKPRHAHHRDFWLADGNSTPSCEGLRPSPRPQRASAHGPI